MDDDRQFLRVKLVQLAHLLIDADVAIGVRQLAEPAIGNLLFPANPAFFLMQVQQLLGLLVRPSRWRLELTQQERRDLDATFEAAAEHLREASRGKAFDLAQVQLVFEALQNLLGLPFGSVGGGGASGFGSLAGYPTPAPDIEPATETVRLGMSAPHSVRPGEHFTARFVAYLPILEQQVREMLANLSPRSTSHLGPKVCHHWVRGTAVTVRLRGDHLVCEKAQQEFTWEGDLSLVDFDVQIQPTAPEGFTILKFDVAIGPLDVGNLRLDLEISKAESVAARRSAAGNAARRAFASYASRDQPRVLDRVAAVVISAGLQVFMDCLSLHPGEVWKPRLEAEILACDLFLLFWSSYARKSAWVEWEWRTALKARGIGAMQLHPLDTVKKAPPPEELKELHFGDMHILARQINRRRRH